MGTLTRLDGKRVYLDANIFIYALEQFEAWSATAANVLAMVDTGQCHAVTSALTLAECMAGPFRAGREDLVRIYDDLIRDRPGLAIAPIERGILTEAARLRAESPSLRLPDAIHIATARSAGCDLVLTNDRRLENAPGVSILMLGALLPE